MPFIEVQMCDCYIQVDVCHMERSKCGLVVGGDKRKMLVNHDDDYYTLMSKCRKVLGLTEPNSLLIAGGVIIGNDSFRNVGHYMTVMHLKPDKVLFGIAGMEKVRQSSQVLLYN